MRSPQLHVTTVGRIRQLATWPHGAIPVEVGQHPCDKYGHGDYRRQPAKDGKIYRVCGRCGVNLGVW